MNRLTWVLFFILGLIAVVFILFKNKIFVFSSKQPSTTNLDQLSDSVSIPNWKMYKNSEYGFEIQFPESYKAYTDKDNLSGWPNAVVLIANDGQSYDLPIEVWDSEMDYKAKYWKYTDLIPYIKVVELTTGKFLTITNQNKEPEVDSIINTFKLTDY